MSSSNVISPRPSRGHVDPGEHRHRNRRLPWSAFDWNAHANDLQLKMASFATQGIWSRLLRDLYYAPEQPGRLALTPAQFTKIIGCRRNEFDRFLKQAREHRFADVRDLDADRVEITCRHMVREDAERRKEADKKDRQRNGTGAEAEPSDPDCVTRSSELCNQIDLRSSNKSVASAATLPSMSPPMSPVDEMRVHEKREDQIKSQQKTKEDSEVESSNKAGHALSSFSSLVKNGAAPANGNGSVRTVPEAEVADRVRNLKRLMATKLCGKTIAIDKVTLHLWNEEVTTIEQIAANDVRHAEVLKALEKRASKARQMDVDARAVSGK